jgi:Rrf2 family protein
LIFQDLDLGETLSPEAKLRATEGGGKYPPEAKSFGKSSAEDLKRREMPSPPLTNCKKRLTGFWGADIRLTRSNLSSLWGSGMRLSRAGEYAVRCVLYLANRPAKEVVPRWAVAQAMEIPEPFLAKIGQQLARAGILEILQGAKGGYRLRRSPQEISLLEVVEAVMGELFLERLPSQARELLQEFALHGSPNMEKGQGSAAPDPLPGQLRKSPGG